MSRNGSGVYSLPAGSTVTNGDTSDATDLNTPLADLEADMNIPRPVVAGGTGASSAAAALVNLGLTATAAELNYTDGVTSAIQTQLDALTSGKQAAGATLTSLEGLSLVAGDLLYATAADTLTRLAKGTAGQALVMNAGATAPEWVSPIALQTTIAAASQTSILFSSIPAWVNRINVHFVGLSTNGTSPVTVRLGDSGGIEATGYSGSSSATGNGVSPAASTYATGFLIEGGVADTAAATRNGVMTLQRVTGNTWNCGPSVIGYGNTAVTSATGGTKTLSDVLTQIAVTTVIGSETFDAGSVNISWE